MRYTFELIGDGEIEMTDHGNNTKSTIKKDMYQMFVEEARRGYTGEDGIILIPPIYYNFLSSDFNVNTPSEKSNDWLAKIPPHTQGCLFDFQKNAIGKMIAHKRCLNATSMGCGKSIQALCSLAALRDPSKGDLIICPGYLRDNWVNEIRTWLGGDTEYHVINKAGKAEMEQARQTLLYARGIKIISYDMAANIFSTIKQTVRRSTRFFNSVICDESHYLKQPRTKRFRMLCDVIRAANHVFLLTGTPSPNHPRDYFAQFSLLKPDVFRRYHTFAERYCGGHIDRFNQYNDRGHTNMRELAHMVSKLIIRIRREDVLTDLPSVVRQKTILPRSSSKCYQKLKKKFDDAISRINKDRDASFEVQSLASQMFLETARIKVSPVVDYFRDYLCGWDPALSSEKVIIYCKHQSMFGGLSDLFDGLEIEFIGISGQTPTSERTRLIQRFLQDPLCGVALLTIGSCATGINLCPVSRMIFTELCWSPSDLSQCEARISRIGGASHLEYTYLVCDGTLDEQVFRKLEHKTSVTNDIVDAGKDYGDFRFAKRQRLT